jgi:hypothetical protein
MFTSTAERRRLVPPVAVVDSRPGDLRFVITGLDPVVSQREILSLNHGNHSCREMLGSSPSTTNSGHAGVSALAPIGITAQRSITWGI